MLSLSFFLTLFFILTPFLFPISIFPFFSFFYFFFSFVFDPLLYLLYRLIGLVGRVFANGLGDLGSIPGRVIPKTLKMVLDTSLLNTQQYKVRIKGKVEQSRERSCAPPYTAIEKGAFWLPSGHLRLRR